MSVYVFSYFPFGFEGRMLDLIVSIPDHCLSFYLVHKCKQQLQLLALHFEILGYILCHLNGLEYLRRIGDFSSDNITRGLLWNILVLAKPWRLTEDADKRFNGLNLTASIKVRKLLIELGIRTEDAECNLRGVKVILNQPKGSYSYS